MILATIPVDPDAPEGRDLLTDELSKPEYAAAQPNLFDILSQAFFDWLGRLFTSGTALPADWLFVAVIALLVIGIIVALIVWGLPRINRRTSGDIDALFGDDDTRSADELRRSAAAAAKQQDFTRAVIEQYRAVARGLAERTVVAVLPGTTAREFATRAGRAFPQLSDELRATSDIFDAVRYLDVPGSAAHYDRIVELDRALSTSTPAVLDDFGAVPSA